MLLTLLLFAAEWKLEAADEPPPEGLSAAVAKALPGRCVRVKDGAAVRLEVWLRAEVPVDATDEQVKNGLTYAEVPGGTLIGAVRLPEAIADYRKQRVPAGVYTLRLAVQPATGDHTGTAPFTEFAVLCAAADDGKPGRMEVKGLIETSAKINDDHPTVMVLFPGHKDATAEPKLVDKGKGHRVLFARVAAVTGKGTKGVLPLGITVEGVSAAR